jgi:hypothetical protein
MTSDLAVSIGESADRIPRWWSKNSWAVSLVIIFATALYGYSAFVDPEPHHDGIQLAPAVAVANGKLIHAEVFDQYGPITAWLHGAVLYVFGPTLLNLRIFTALLLVGCAVMMFFVARRMSFVPAAAALVSVLWVTLWPGRSIDSLTSSLLPWPSTVFLAFQLGVALVLLRIVSRRSASRRALVIVGILMSLAALVRPNYGIVLIVGAVIALLLFVPEVLRRTRGWVALAAGILAPVILLLAYLVMTDSFEFFVQQSLLGPIAGKSTGATTEWFYFKNVYLLGSFPLLIAILISVLATRCFRARPRIVAVVVVMCSLGLLTVVSTSIQDSPLRNLLLSRLTWSPALDPQAAQLMFTSVLVFMAGGSILVFRTLAKRNRWPSDDCPVAAIFPPKKTLTISLLILTLSSVSELYPFADAYHLWWAAPLLLISAIVLVGQVTPTKFRTLVLLGALLPYLLIGIVRTVHYVSEPRSRIEVGVLNGMYGRDSSVDSIKQIESMIGLWSPESTRFECPDALYSVWTGSFLSNSPDIVDWSFGTPLSPEPQPSRVMVCLAPGRDDAQPEAPVRDGYAVAKITGPVQISYFGRYFLYEYLPVS